MKLEFSKYLLPFILLTMDTAFTNELLVKRDYLHEIQPLSQSYAKGDKGLEVQKIEQWLMLWQLNQNYVKEVIHITPDDEFNDTTERVVKEVQSFLNITPTGVVDDTTWYAMTSPMREAFDLKSYKFTTLREKMKYFATRHLQYRASELKENNEGPWVRAYMDDHDGSWAYWCQGFVDTILDQTFSSINRYFNEFYANTWACEVMRKKARHHHLLVTHTMLKNKQYIPQTGDMVLYISDKDSKAHHVEIIYEVLDEQTGDMVTIGGNTNFSGSRNGIGVFLVNRNFLDPNVEVVKLIDEGLLATHANYPKDVHKLLRSYPNSIYGFRDNKVIFANGRQLIYDDHIQKNHTQLLTHPSIKDQFVYAYPKGKLMKPMPRYQDPGRVTNQDFFKTIYGGTKEEVEKNLTTFVWAPNVDGSKFKATTINGVASKLKAIGEYLDDFPELAPYLKNIGGTYKWRKVAGTDRLSLHSFGIAIDLNVSLSRYWEWDCKCSDENVLLPPVHSKMPQIIIDTFEKYGFIWGGKWYHYDTMHFEYRPELLAP